MTIEKKSLCISLPSYAFGWFRARANIRPIAAPQFDQLLKLLPRLVVKVVPFEHPPPGRTVLTCNETNDLVPGFKTQPFDEVARKKHRKEPDLHPVENVVGIRGEEIGSASEHQAVTSVFVQEAAGRGKDFGFQPVGAFRFRRSPGVSRCTHALYRYRRASSDDTGFLKVPNRPSVSGIYIDLAIQTREVDVAGSRSHCFCLSFSPRLE